MSRTLLGCALVLGTLLLTTSRLSAQQPTDSAARVDSLRADSIRTDSLRSALLRGLQARVDSAEKARLDSLRHFQLAAVVVTATRLSGVDERAPVQVEALDIPMLIPSPDAAPKALLSLAGVNSYDDQGQPLQPEIEVRGFTLSPVVGQPQGIAVFLNGVRMNEPDAQEVNFDLLPMAAVGASSLVRGSNVLFGRNSLGGTLLLTTNRGTSKPEFEIEAGGGSFGQQSLTVTGGGKIGRVDAFFAAAGSDIVGWRQATAGRTRNVFGTLGYQWGATHDSGDVALDVLWGRDKLFQAGSLPESFVADFPQLNYTPGDFFAPDAHAITLRGNQPIGGGIFRGTLFYRNNDYEQFNVNVPPVNPSTDGFINNRSEGGTFEWTRPVRVVFPIGFTIGVDYERDDVHYKLGLKVPNAPDSITTIADVSPQDTRGVYAQAIISLSGRLNLTAGLRVDHIRIPYTDQLVDTNSGTNLYDRFSPELGLNFNLTNDVKAFAAYKVGFRSPAALELACASPTAPCSLPSALGADPHLNPVTTHDYEGGFDVEFSRRSSLDVSAFWTDVDNDIHFASPNLIQAYYFNVPRTRRAGVETSARLGLPGHVNLLASYSYVAATYQSTVQIATADTNPQPAKPGDIFPNSPRHRWRVGAETNHQLGPVALDAAIDVKGYSAQYLRGDEANRRAQVPGYTLTSLQAQFSVNRYSLHLEVENLLDNRHTEFGVVGQDLLFPPGAHISLDEANGPIVPFLSPALPRRFTLTASVRF